MEVVALIIALAGAGFIALNVSGQSLPGPFNVTGNYNFTDFAGNHKNFSQLKKQAWGETQTQINYILTSSAWGNWRNNNSFLSLTNGEKIDAVITQIGIDYPGALHGFGFSPPLISGNDPFSYLDFVWPGIDLKNLGAGSENAFQLLLHDLNLTCVGTTIAGAVATASSAGALSIPSMAASTAACKVH